MKKAIAILLACIMLLGCAPVMAFAEDEEATGTYITENTTIDVNTSFYGNYYISAELTVASDATLTIEEGCYLYINGTAGRIVNKGKIVVKGYGAVTCQSKGTAYSNASFYNDETGVLSLNTNCYFGIEKNSYLYNKGQINNVERMTINGELKHYVSFPSHSFDIDYKRTEMWNRTATTVTYTVKYVKDSDLAKETDYLNAEEYDAVPSDEWLTHGEKVYILITPEDGDGDWVDTGRMKLDVNGTLFGTNERIDNDRGVFTVTPVDSMKISVGSTAYKDIVKLFEITLPSTEGYYVKSKDGDVGEVVIEYGKTLSFTVVLDDAYDKSTPSAYAGTNYIEPDEYGYFDVLGYKDGELLTAGGIQEDFSITIMNVSSNEKREQANSIVNFIKQIFETIKSIFGYFADLFTGLGSLGGTTETV